MLVILIALAIIAVLFFIFLLLRKSEAPAPGQKYPVKRAAHRAKGKPDDSISKQFHNTDIQRKMLLDLYPALNKIEYFSVPEGVFPTQARDIDENIRAAIKEKVSSIKPIPANYVKLINLLRNPESNPGEISNIVSTNPVFSARILQTVNSAYFGLNEKVASLGRAITLLGYNNVRALAFQESLGSALPGQQLGDPEAYVNIWMHSAIVSVCAGHLGKKMFQYSEYDLATIGLLHDIGKYFIRSLESREEPDSSLPHIIQEERQYGINHAALGTLIADSWKLSDNIMHGIEYHHYPNFLPPEAIPGPYLKQSFVVCISDLVAKAFGYKGQEDEILPIKDEYFEMFRLSSDLPEIITPVLTKEIEKARLTVESYIKATLSA